MADQKDRIAPRSPPSPALESVPTELPPPCGRFAPSTTGDAHLGTLLSALLCWLDARQSNARLILRLEDLDPQRCRPAHARDLRDALTWLGLDWDETVEQSSLSAGHHAALDQLETDGHLYPCACSRSLIRRRGRPAADGGIAYPNTCAHLPLPPGGWRSCARRGVPVRARLPGGTIQVTDASGASLSQDPREAMGDPVVVRRDGSVAYQLAVVVDDQQAGVTRIVRGRDIAPSTATQVALQRLLGLPPPQYRHHFLLLEPRGDKLAKTHGSVGSRTLQSRYSGAQVCGTLAAAAGLCEVPAPSTPQELIHTFCWSTVSTADRILTWGEKNDLPSATTPK